MLAARSAERASRGLPNSWWCCCRTRVAAELVVRRTRALLPMLPMQKFGQHGALARRLRASRFAFSPRQHEALRWGFRVQTLTCGDRPLDARALRYGGDAQMSTPSSGLLRPLSHTEPHTPSHTTTATRFSCCRCGFESHVDYHGRTPPFNRSIVFLEAVYLIRSPMGDANRPLCLGGTCVVWCATT